MLYYFDPKTDSIRNGALVPHCWGTRNSDGRLLMAFSLGFEFSYEYTALEWHGTREWPPLSLKNQESIRTASRIIRRDLEHLAFSRYKIHQMVSV